MAEVCTLKKIESQVSNLKSADARLGSKIEFEKRIRFFCCFLAITFY